VITRLIPTRGAPTNIRTNTKIIKMGINPKRSKEDLWFI
jgi:hypothetical protein